MSNETKENTLMGNVHVGSDNYAILYISSGLMGKKGWKNINTKEDEAKLWVEEKKHSNAANSIDLSKLPFHFIFTVTLNSLSTVLLPVDNFLTIIKDLFILLEML